MLDRQKLEVIFVYGRRKCFKNVSILNNKNVLLKLIRIIFKWYLIYQGIIETNNSILLNQRLYFLYLPFQMTASTQSRVLLENVQVKQSGTYLCEVTVTPGYYALMQFANMTVVGKLLHNTMKWNSPRA